MPAAVPYTGVPTVAAEGGGPNTSSVRATPESFGADVGQAEEKAGDAGVDVAMKQQGMINETLMTNADAQLAMKVGQIKGAYLQNTGLAAQAAFPQYQAQLEQARQDARAALPPAAAHGFDMLATRTIANHIADGSSYMASQIKAANIDSGSQLQNVMAAGVLDPQVASDPKRVDYHLGSGIHAIQMQMDENSPGLKKDPETGAVSFDESTPAGVALKANYQAKVDNFTTQLQTNRFNTLANINPISAFDTYKQEKDTFPKSTQVQLESMLAPRVFDAHVDRGTTEILAQAEQAHAQMLYNPHGGADAAINTVMKNEGGMNPHDGNTGAPALYGINAKYHPEEFAEASKIRNEQGEQAAQDYAKSFYKTEYYDKKGIGDLPPATQAIVMDGVVNHYPGFGDKLIADAKNGASPQQLIDERRQEYQRLASSNPSQYGDSLAGWNNRLDGLQSMVGKQQGMKSYATNENGAPLSQADYFRTHSEDVLQRVDAMAEKNMPGDLAYRRAVRETASNYMAKTIQNETAQFTQDNRNVMRAITGEMTNGNPPQTQDELMAIPGIGPLVNKVAAQDPKFWETIPAKIAQAAKKNVTVNSPNGYDTIMRTLEPNDQGSPNRIESVDHLDKLVGRSDGTGINMKDYNDAKKSIEASDAWKGFLSKNMQYITNANGNLDGKGQQRALDWYNQITDAKKENDAKGDRAIPESAFIKSVDEKIHPLAPSPPSRMQQISNWAKSATGMGTVRVINANGQIGTIPAGQLNDAKKAGYKEAP